MEVYQCQTCQHQTGTLWFENIVPAPEREHRPHTSCCCVYVMVFYGLERNIRSREICDAGGDDVRALLWG